MESDFTAYEGFKGVFKACQYKDVSIFYSFLQREIHDKAAYIHILYVFFFCSLDIHIVTKFW